MARRGSVLEPTLHVFDRSADTTLVQWSKAVTLRAHNLGVPIVAGTDGLIDPGRSAMPNVHHEMALMVDAGLSPAQALAAATVAAARAMGRGETHGVVAAGRVADLVLLRADPLSSIEATTDIRRVVRRGRILDVGR